MWGCGPQEGTWWISPKLRFLYLKKVLRLEKIGGQETPVNPFRTLMGPVVRWVFGLHGEETGYARRGFRGATREMRQRLEQIGATFLEGYHAALRFGSSGELSARLDTMPEELRGFAYEGAAMGLALLDALTPWSGRVVNFMGSGGERHVYMVHVGVGWIWARTPWFLHPHRNSGLDPLLRWLAYDGWGFHEGFFHWPKYAAGQASPGRVQGYAKRVFDQGLGRSFWFVNGGNPAWIKRTILELAPERHSDLWSGIGLAATYAGIVEEPVLLELLDAAGDHRAALRQGAVFALKARERAGNVTNYQDLAARVLCGMEATQAARLADSTLDELISKAATGRPGSPPLYELWRTRIRETLGDHSPVPLETHELATVN